MTTRVRPSNQQVLPMVLVALIVSVLSSLYVVRQQRVEMMNAAETVPDAAVAVVNGKHIRLAEYIAILGAIAADKRSTISDADRILALERLIEEEILIQSGLAERDVFGSQLVRQQIITTMLDQVLAEVNSEEITRSTVSTFCQKLSSADPSAPDQSDPAKLDCVYWLSQSDGGSIEAYRAYKRDQLFRKYIDRLRASARIERSKE